MFIFYKCYRKNNLRGVKAGTDQTACAILYHAACGQVYVNMPGKVAHFVPPVIQDNPDGWGPCEVPDKYKDMPYQPFSKADRLGKVNILRQICYIY